MATGSNSGIQGGVVQSCVQSCTLSTTSVLLQASVMGFDLIQDTQVVFRALKAPAGWGLLAAVASRACLVNTSKDALQDEQLVRGANGKMS